MGRSIFFAYLVLDKNFIFLQKIKENITKMGLKLCSKSFNCGQRYDQKFSCEAPLSVAAQNQNSKVGPKKNGLGSKGLNTPFFFFFLQ